MQLVFAQKNRFHIIRIIFHKCEVLKERWTLSIMSFNHEQINIDQELIIYSHLFGKCPISVEILESNTHL